MKENRERYIRLIIRQFMPSMHCPYGVGLVETSIEAGKDLSGLWGPGIALVWKNRTIKFNMRPGNESGSKNNGAWRFTVFDGKKENIRAGGKDNVDFSKTWSLR